MNALSQFQDDFIAAIYADGNDAFSPVAALTAQPGFDIYRNTIIKGCMDALQANYPTVERLVGADWFRAAAAIYARQSPPTSVSLMEYGDTFADFLDSFEHAQALPYLANVARVDRDWIQVHIACDETSLNASVLSSLAPEQLGNVVLQPLAAAQWRWFDTQPIYAIWSVNRQALVHAEDGVSDNREEIDWRGQGVLLWRQDGIVQWREASAGDCAFLDACAEGAALGAAAQAALEAEPGLDVARMLSDLLSAGVFAASPNFLFNKWSASTCKRQLPELTRAASTKGARTGMRSPTF